MTTESRSAGRNGPGGGRRISESVAAARPVGPPGRPTPLSSPPVPGPAGRRLPGPGRNGGFRVRVSPARRARPPGPAGPTPRRQARRDGVLGGSKSRSVGVEPETVRGPPGAGSGTGTDLNLNHLKLSL